MLDPVTIRNRLKENLGEERYKKFVSQLPASDVGTRMRFWQERAWESFVLANPDCELSFVQLVPIFADCPAYGAKMRRAKQLARITSWLKGVISTDELEKSTGKDGLNYKNNLRVEMKFASFGRLLKHGKS